MSREAKPDTEFVVPRHVDPESKERVASAPYNFVPLPDAIIAARSSAADLPDHDKDDGKSGYFDVKLTTRSPLYIRAPLDSDDARIADADKTQKGVPFCMKVKNIPDFFFIDHATKAPRIPGSSLRGMLSTLVEAISHSVPRFVTQEQMFYRILKPVSVGHAYQHKMDRKQAGFLKRDCDGATITLCDYAQIDNDTLAETFGVEVDDIHVSDSAAGQPIPNSDLQAKPIWIQEPVRIAKPQNTREPRRLQSKWEKASGECPDGWVPGWVVMTGPAPKKEHEFVFVESAANPKTRHVSPKVLGQFEHENQITQWQKAAYPTDGKVQDGLCGDKGAPVFFVESEDETDEDGKPAVEFFGRAGLFRLPYANHADCLVPNYPVDQDTVIDYARALFGYIDRPADADQGSKERAYASRVRVTDAICKTCEKQGWWLDSVPGGKKTIVPRILSTPKPTSFQHYLVQDREEPGRLRSYDDVGRNGETVTTLRGHKYYWHQGERSVKDLEDAEFQRRDEQQKAQDTQHTQVSPVKPDVKFSFRVHFDNLSTKELGALCWALTLPGPKKDEEGKDLCFYHHLGMGKPYGMGSVELDASLRIITRKKRYSALFTADESGKTEWFTGAGVDDPETYIRTFERDILDTLGYPDEQHRLCDLERVEMLLRLHQWRGVPADWREHDIAVAEIADGNRRAAPPGRDTLGNTRHMLPKEFQKRPVLPTPFDGRFKSALGPWQGRRIDEVEVVRQSRDGASTGSSRGGGGRKGDRERNGEPVDVDTGKPVGPKQTSTLLQERAKRSQGKAGRPLEPRAEFRATKGGPAETTERGQKIRVRPDKNDRRKLGIGEEIEVLMTAKHVQRFTDSVTGVVTLRVKSIEEDGTPRCEAIS